MEHVGIFLYLDKRKHLVRTSTPKSFPDEGYKFLLLFRS